MNAFKKFFNTTLMTIIAIIAIVNLIALFVFHYRIPDAITSRIPFLSSNNTQQTAVTTQQGTGTLQILVPEGAYEYNGDGEFDPTADVSLQNADGSESSAILTVDIVNGNAKNTKIIKYSATGDNNITVRAERTLTLGDSYKGPSIKVSDKLTKINKADITDLTNILAGGGYISADDGFGNDITSDIKSSAAPYGSSGTYQLDMSVKNVFGDSTSVSVPVDVATGGDASTKKSAEEKKAEASTEAQSESETESEVDDMVLDPNGPWLKLTADYVTIGVGSEFNFMAYIESAKDINGNDLWTNISMEGSVDTNTPGEYKLKFWCTDNNGNVSIVKELTVSVE